MTIYNRNTGNLYLNSRKFNIVYPDGRKIDFDVNGLSAGLGGVVFVRNGNVEEEIRVLPDQKVEIFGEEFFGNYGDVPRKETIPVSARYPERK